MFKAPDLSNKRLNSQYLDSRGIGGAARHMREGKRMREKKGEMFGHSKGFSASQSDRE